MNDPRKHTSVRSIHGDAVTYKCGCVNAIDPPTGMLRSRSKCQRHKRAQRDPATLDERYYKELGVLKDGMLAETKHVAELVEALGDFPAPGFVAEAMELGPGVSPYLQTILDAGYWYTGVEASSWAAHWLRDMYSVDFLVTPFELLDREALRDEYSLILAAHVLEHLADAPTAILSLSKMLRQGGELWIVVPDDSDPLNSDHLWFFTESGLRRCVESVGLVVERTAVRRHVAHENFIYLRARKP